MRAAAILVFGLVVLVLAGCPFAIPIPGPESGDYPGATLVGEFDTGGSNGGYNLATDGAALYTADWNTNQLMKASIADQQSEAGYPVTLSNATGVHGITFDSTDGSLWACDLDGQTLAQYDATLGLANSKTMTGQPVGCAVDANSVYVVDRQTDTITVLDRDTLDVTSQFAINASANLETASYIDITVDGSFLYVAGEDIAGFVRMDLDGSGQTPTNVEDTAFPGIAISDGMIYLNSGNEILVLDNTHEVVNRWDLEYPDVVYTDVVVVGDIVYTTTATSGEAGVSPHVLAYQPN